MEVFLQSEIKEREQGTVLVLSGHLTRATCRKMSFLFKELLTEQEYIALDLSGLLYLDAKGLELISNLLGKLKKKHIDLYAFGMNNEIHDILSVVDSTRGIKLVENDKVLRRSVKKAYSN
ncbi:STAS domain-containing protein [Fibrobacterota bacterium]